nr:immunoglobulin heavy chain junction region [Macaca mulatta]
CAGVRGAAAGFFDFW